MDPARRRLVIAWLTMGWLGGTARAEAVPDLSAVFPGAKKVGQGKLRWMGFPIYLAELWSTDGTYQADRAFILSLTYFRGISQTQIVNASIEQMQKLGAPVEEHPDWVEKLATVFQDVGESDNISGVFYPGDHAQFYFNFKPAGKLDALLADHLAAIWLSPRTTEPSLRQALLGQSE
jgi:hypothetical protein